MVVVEEESNRNVMVAAVVTGRENNRNVEEEGKQYK